MQRIAVIVIFINVRTEVSKSDIEILVGVEVGEGEDVVVIERRR